MNSQKKWYERYSHEVNLMTERYTVLNQNAEVRVHKATDVEIQRFENMLRPKNYFKLHNKIRDKEIKT